MLSFRGHAPALNGSLPFIHEEETKELSTGAINSVISRNECRNEKIVRIGGENAFK